MSPRLAGNIIAMVSMALWASGFVALQALLRSWDPLLLAPLRMALAALALTLVLGLGGRIAELRALPWRQALVTGGLGLGCSGLLIVWGQSKSDALTASIITTALPLLAALMSAAAGDERLRASLLGGVGLAICGGLLATLGTAQAGPGFRGGEVMVLGAILFFVWYSRRTVTHFPGVRDLPKTAAALISGTLVLLFFAALGLGTGLAEPRYDFSPRALLLLAWMGPIAFAGASFLWLRATRMLGVTVAGIHQNEIPFFVMALLLAFGGTFDWLHVAGAFLVLAGAGLAQMRQVMPLLQSHGRQKGDGT
jgi:drug/metabolite transporter (DMT)-like permease